MKSETPKQFLDLGNKPILMHTIDAFHSYDKSIEIRVVLPTSLTNTWSELCKKYHYDVAHEIFEGGETRFHSVLNGLQGISEEALVAIHDGVRPLVSADTIGRAYKTAEQSGTAVPVIGIKESVRETEGIDTFARDRTRYVKVQTPQVFHASILLDAYQTDFDETFTDDASVVEKAGYKIVTCEGNEENIKITTPVDFVIAEALMNQRIMTYKNSQQ